MLSYVPPWLSCVCMRTQREFLLAKKVFMFVMLPSFVENHYPSLVPFVDI